MLQLFIVNNNKMTVTEVQYGSSTTGQTGTALVRISGTIAEVLQDLANKSINASRLIWYLDDNTDAEAVYCKQK